MIKKIVKLSFLSALFAIAIFFIAEINSQRPDNILRDLLRKNHLNGQNYNLKLNFLMFIPVGQAKFEKLPAERFRNQDLIHISAQARTLGYLKVLFYANAKVDSYIEPKNLDSVYFLQHMEIINKPDEDKEISYDQKKHIMRYTGRRGTEERVIDEHTRDPLAVVFYLQNMEFNLNEEVKFSLNTNQKIYVLSGKFIKKEIVKVAGKDYVLWLIDAKVSRKDKNPRHKTSLRIWFCETDKEKMPILIKAMTNIGPIVAKAE